MASRPRRSVRLWPVLGAVLWAAPACDSGNAATGRATLSVFAASSLTEAFQELEQRFEQAHPNVDVRLTFAGSQVLRLQLEQGATADVFASANEAYMRALSDRGVVSASSLFARNALAVIVPRNDPAAIATFADLPRASRLVIGAGNVPVGMYTRQVLDRAAARFGEGFAAEVRSHVVSEESNVRLVRAKVALGEADAAIVYRTDAASTDRVRAIAIPDPINARASYLMAVVTRSAHPHTARRFIAFVLSEQGQAVLVRHGFATAAQ